MSFSMIKDLNGIILSKEDTDQLIIYSLLCLLIEKIKTVFGILQIVCKMVLANSNNRGSAPSKYVPKLQ